MDRFEAAIRAPLLVVGQWTEAPAMLVVLLGVLAGLIGWIAVRRPLLAAVWPVPLLPLPWMLLMFWAGWHNRTAGPQTGFHAEAWGVLMLGVTLSWSGFALTRGRGIRAQVAGLALLNAVFALTAALFAGMMTTGTWL